MSCQEKTDHRTCDHSGIVQKEAVQGFEHRHADDTADASGNYRDHHLYSLEQEKTQRSKDSCLTEKLLHGFPGREDPALETCTQKQEKNGSADDGQSVFFEFFCQCHEICLLSVLYFFNLYG